MGKVLFCEYQQQEKAVPGTQSWESHPFSTSPFGVLSGGGDAWRQKGLDRPEHPKEPGEGGCMRAKGGQGPPLTRTPAQVSVVSFPVPPLQICGARL